MTRKEEREKRGQARRAWTDEVEITCWVVESTAGEEFEWFEIGCKEMFEGTGSDWFEWFDDGERVVRERLQGDVRWC